MNYRREDILDLKHLSASSLLIAGVLYFEPDEEGRSDPKYMYKFFGLTKKAFFIRMAYSVNPRIRCQLTLAIGA